MPLDFDGVHQCEVMTHNPDRGYPQHQVCRWSGTCCQEGGFGLIDVSFCQKGVAAHFVGLLV
jgi:hypothetical protein